MSDARRPDAPLAQPRSAPATAVLAALGVDPRRGLSAPEARRRRARHGPNLLRRRKARGVLAILAGQFRSLIVWLLAAAAGLSFALGDLTEGAAILVVLVLNGAIGFTTEWRATRSMEALQRIARVRTRARRGGAVRALDAQDLVPGDIVILEAGDVITADLRLIEAANLYCDESVLTGESLPVAKRVEPVAPDAPLGDRSSLAFKGTAVTRGAGEAVVVATGMNTELGTISRLAQEARGEVSPLEKRLDRLGHKLIGLTLALAALTALAGVARGRDPVAMVETGIALAVAAVPEGLPVVATLCLARGMWRMARRNALIARLSAVETLGATTVILTDKTGTLTENRMTVTGFRFADGDRPVEPAEPGSALDRALHVAVLCNNASLGEDGDRDDAGSGDPMERALLAAGREAGLARDAALARLPEVRQHAFDPARLMMATVHRDGDGFLVAVKGAPERVVDAAARVLTPDGPVALDAAGRAAWMERAREAAGRGERLLGLAMKGAATPDADPYGELTLVGLVRLVDPPRADVPDAIAACRGAGVRVVMLTGDHAATAAEIARAVGLAGDGGTALEGRDLADVDWTHPGKADERRLIEARVFARVSPETKLRLAAFYQRRGHVVAMTGDGVNDAPALKQADIGIAMGKRGTDVAREAAHMVLKDDAFPTIVHAMREGRVIFENIRKFVVYLMSCNLSEVLVVGLAVGAGLPAPLLPLQILFLNLVTDVFPAFALGLGEDTGNAMAKPPRPPREPLVDAPRWRLIALLGGSITLATLGAFAAALFWLRLPPDQAVTVAFATLALAQLWNVFNVRDPDSGWIGNEVTRNPFVWAALGLCLGLIGAALFIPALAAVLNLPFPGAAGVALAALASLAPWAAGQLLIARPARR